MRLLTLLLISFFVNDSLAQNADAISKTAEFLQRFEPSDAPGFSIGIVENGRLIYSKGIGFADLDHGTMNSDSTIFGIASIAKQFTAACIWSLVKEGRISLDDDVRKYIPEFPSYGDVIRIRHLLNHTSGIRNYHALMDLSGFNYDKAFHDNQMILDLACRQYGLNNRPGEKVVYGNTSYTLLAIVIERITGQNLNLYAQDKIFLPLGMHHTFYRVDTTTVVSNQALGYFLDNDKRYTPVTNHQISYGAGSVKSSIEDLATWSTVLNGIHPEYLDLTRFLTTTETTRSGEALKYARGVMVDAYKGVKTIHHSGYSLGGQSEIIAVPELQLAIIVLANLESINPAAISYAVLDLFLPVQTAESIQSGKVFHRKRRQLRKFAGAYQELNSDMRMEILLENDTLKGVGSQGKMPVSLVATDKGKFVRSNNQSVSYDFRPAKNMHADLIIYFGGTPFYFSKARFIDPGTIHLTDYTGNYYSPELSIAYEVYVEDNSLFVSYADRQIKLHAGQKDEFGNGQRILYRFERNKKGEVTQFYLSAEGTVKNIQFDKK